MLNFDATSKQYKEKVRWDAQDLVEDLVKDHLMKGGSFDAVKITKFFNDSIRSSQLLVDLFIGAGLSPLEDAYDGNTNSEAATTGQNEGGLPANAFTTDGVSDLGKADPEGPTGSGGNEKRVAHTASEPDTADDNGTAGSGEVDAPKQQPVSAITGPGTGRGHSSRSSSS